jgi:hypothetical protein
MKMKRRQQIRTCREAAKKEVVEGTTMGKGKKREIRAGRDMMGKVGCFKAFKAFRNINTRPILQIYRSRERMHYAEIFAHGSFLFRGALLQA